MSATKARHEQHVSSVQLILSLHYKATTAVTAVIFREIVSSSFYTLLSSIHISRSSVVAYVILATNLCYIV
jgi:hypothetical protein